MIPVVESSAFLVSILSAVEEESCMDVVVIAGEGTVALLVIVVTAEGCGILSTAAGEIICCLGEGSLGVDVEVEVEEEDDWDLRTYF